MRDYQVTVVFNPAAKVAEATGEIKDFITSSGATINSEEDLGPKKLAYEIGGQLEGLFYELKISGPADLTAKLAESLRINNQVIRFLIKLHTDVATTINPVTETKSK